MNLHEIPTPLTDAATYEACLFGDAATDPRVSRDLERKLTAATRFIKLVSEQDSGDVGAYEAIVKDARETLAIITPKP